MKKLTILSPIHAAILLSVLFLASCGGGDDGPIAPGSDAEGDNPAANGNGRTEEPVTPEEPQETDPVSGRLDSRLFGTWVVSGEAGSILFGEDGSADFDGFNCKWWIESGQLVLEEGDRREVYDYEVSDNNLTIRWQEDGDEQRVTFSRFSDSGEEE